MISVKRKVHFVRRSDKSRALVVNDTAPTPIPAGRVPRISRLMALAIHFDRLIREGKVRDQSELARLAHVTQPRMTQIMNLNHLAPDIQEELLQPPAGHDILDSRTHVVSSIADQLPVDLRRRFHLWDSSRKQVRRVSNSLCSHQIRGRTNIL